MSDLHNTFMRRFVQFINTADEKLVGTHCAECAVLRSVLKRTAHRAAGLSESHRSDAWRLSGHPVDA
jgi:hypothetical protein